MAARRLRTLHRPLRYESCLVLPFRARFQRARGQGSADVHHVDKKLTETSARSALSAGAFGRKRQGDSTDTSTNVTRAMTQNASADPVPTETADAEGRLAYSSEKFRRLTHYLFKYPAKFHPPVARHLVQAFTTSGQTVLDPFCGSGTLLVEASVLGRHSIGTDIDPIATLASSVKAKRVRPGALDKSADRLMTSLHTHRRSDDEYERRKFDDYTAQAYRGLVTKLHLDVPTIPNLFHWFRKYVVIDLALIKRTIERLRGLPHSHRNIFRLVFAATIRRASNADPVPVSGLEVTHHMIQLDEAGRVINPFALFEQELRRTCGAFREYWEETSPGYNGRAFRCDARQIAKRIPEKVDAVITSPPYHGAVDYYRRHTLETYWLGFAKSLEDRFELLPRYIGRAKVSVQHEYAKTAAISAPYMKAWEAKLRRADTGRADAFRHYALSMQAALAQLAMVLPAGAPAVLIVGNSRWKDEEIDTAKLLAELSRANFGVAARYWYPLKNRYMSYSRHNGADINREHVVVLERRGGR